jgi:hypothetical protein
MMDLMASLELGGIGQFSCQIQKFLVGSLAVSGTPAARGLEEFFSAVLERFLEPIHALHV